MSRLMQMVLLESVDSWSQFPPQYDIGAAQLGPNCQVSTCNAPRCHDVEHLQDSPGIHGGGESSIPSRTCGLTLQRRGPLRVMDPGLWPIPYLSDLVCIFALTTGPALPANQTLGCGTKLIAEKRKATPRTSLAASFSEPHPTFSTLDTRDHTELCVVARKSPV